MLLCSRTDQFALLQSGSFSQEFRMRNFQPYCSQPNFDWRRISNQSCTCTWFFWDSKPNVCKTTNRHNSTNFSLDYSICVQYSLKLYEKETKIFLISNYWFSVINLWLVFCHPWRRCSLEVFSWFGYSNSNS